VAPITASGKHLFAVSNATAGKIKFLRLAAVTGTTARAFNQLATTITIAGGGRLYVTAMGW
jgi:hypothetical protein